MWHVWCRPKHGMTMNTTIQDQTHCGTSGLDKRHEIAMMLLQSTAVLDQTKCGASDINRRYLRVQMEMQKQIGLQKEPRQLMEEVATCYQLMVNMWSAWLILFSNIKVVLCSLSINGNIQDLGSLYGSLESYEYKWFHEMVGQVLNNKKGGFILMDQLEKWVKKARCGLENSLNSEKGGMSLGLQLYRMVQEYVLSVWVYMDLYRPVQKEGDLLMQYATDS
ncbi:hypothetical protein HD554DRAFT_2042302 [Boletus coccyginus]|nr:hypothetical protein HD554DRAFT_2042302 [Boletus coccyginus]